MQLPNSLIKAFTKIASTSSNESGKKSSVRGTAVVTDGKKYVRLDSSDLLTPISEATDVQNGDRVLVSIENHVATVVGNYTCPASARTASKFLKLTDDGLLVGDLDDDGNAKGTGSLIAPGVYYVVDDDGNQLASFAPGEINLGDLEAIIRFCGGNCRIYSSDGVMVLYATNAVGLRSSFTASGYDYKAEVVCQAKDKNPVVSIQAYRNDDENPAHISVTRDGIALVGDVVSYNGSEILRSNKLVASGTVTATGSIKANSTCTFTCTLTTIPDGYHLAGVREVKTSNGNATLVSFYTHPSTKQVGARYKNTTGADITDLTITIEWFALYTKGEKYAGEDIITFEDDDAEGGS